MSDLEIHAIVSIVSILSSLFDHELWKNCGVRRRRVYRGIGLHDGLAKNFLV